MRPEVAVLAALAMAWREEEDNGKRTSPPARPSKRKPYVSPSKAAKRRRKAESACAHEVCPICAGSPNPCYCRGDR